MIVFKRWRHLVTFLVCLSVLGVLGTGINFVNEAAASLRGRHHR